jgi:signal transduction histidine kinase
VTEREDELARSRPALDEAVRRVGRSWDLIREDAASAGEVGALAAELGRAVAAMAALPGEPQSRPSNTPLARRLLAMLRREFVNLVAASDGEPHASGLLAYLKAFEDLAAELEPPWDQRFTDRLSGPDGLELVVEVAHDLRSPLTSILFLAETLQRGRSGPVTPLQERQLGLIYSAAFGLSSVASDVIELARGGDRLVDLEPVPFSIADIFESVRDIVLPIAEEKGLDVRVAPPERTSRIGHPVALSRVLLNLTTNALKFTDSGYIEMRGTEVGPNLLELGIRDTGRGIPPASLAMLFEPFRRRQKERDYAFSGSGLGLSICRKLVEAMKGELQVETGSNGTRFHFTLELPQVETASVLGGELR